MIKQDIESAISAHKYWKTRLSLMLGEIKREQLDPIEVGDPSRCDLGNWLIKATENTLDDPLLNSLITTHHQFHRLAASIVSLINDGKNSQAKNLLDKDFAELSADIVDLLTEVLIRRRHANS